MGDRRRKRINSDEILQVLMEASDNDEPFEDSGSSFHCSGSENESSSTSGEDEEEPIVQQDDQENVEDNEWVDIEPESNSIVFTGEEKIIIELPLGAKPIDYFMQIFDDTLVQKIVSWTNERAEVKRKPGTLRENSNLRRWKEVSAAEMKKVIALCLLMPLNKKAELRLYWSKNELYFQKIFGDTMSRIRFENILRCMCFFDDQNIDRSHRLYKINNVVNHILKNIKNTYSPGENLSLDESLLLWRGRLFFRQYIPNKKHKYGIKIYELCTPEGFLLNMLIYTGRGTVTNEKGHAYAVVAELMKNYLQKGHSLYIDNFYSSTDLGEYLINNRTNMCGTLRSNRKRNPSFVIRKKLKRGETCWRRNRKNIIVLKWKDKRDVLMISTKHTASMVRATSSKGKESIKPQIVHEYNKNMSGIDRADQMMAYYACPRRSVRWYMKVFFHLLDISLWNSCWLFNKKNPEKQIPFLSFREEVIKSFLGPIPTDRSATFAVAGPSTAAPGQSQHFPDISKNRKRCRQCHKDKKRTATKYICDVCTDKYGEKIGLCPHPCFKIWHSS